jgi:hypothetical protein
VGSRIAARTTWAAARTIRRWRRCERAARKSLPAAIDALTRPAPAASAKTWQELDQFGGGMDRPLFQQALERIERGETGGLIVAKLDRFARTLTAREKVEAEALG